MLCSFEKQLPQEEDTEDGQGGRAQLQGEAIGTATSQEPSAAATAQRT